MKVKCTQCGKRFDYDVHLGKCPKCFTYHKMNSDTDQQPESTKSKPAPSKQQNTSSSSQPEQQKPKKTRHSRSYHIVTIVLCSIIILLIVLTFILTNLSNKSGYAAASLTELPEPISLSLGDAAIIPYAEDNFSISITDATIINDSTYQVPAGYELIRVSYSAGSSKPYGAPSEPDYGYYDNHSIRWGLKPYLITKSGSYLPPLGKYDFEETDILESEAANELELSTYFEDAVGFFYFLVKENDTQGLRINCHKEQSDGWGHSIEQLEICYEIKDLEVY